MFTFLENKSTLQDLNTHIRMKFVREVDGHNNGIGSPTRGEDYEDDE